MDYCKEFPALVDHCYIYRHDGTDWLKTSDFGDLDKLNVLFSLYLQRSDEMVETVLKLYVRLAQHLRDAVFHLPELPKWDDGPSSANAMIAFDRVIADVAAGATGTPHFAHLLSPPAPSLHLNDSTLRHHSQRWRSTSRPL